MAYTEKIVFLFILLAPAMALPQVNYEVDKTTGLKSWGFTQSGLELRLVQRLPDQTRGFFQGRGFSKQQADEIATQCVFQTIAKNFSSEGTDKPVSILLKTWRVKVNELTQGIILKEEWDKKWSAITDKSMQVKASARIAFRWSTFPSEQTFEPGGDYNWGMISFGLPPGETFDLHVFWTTDNQLYERWIENIQCPKDL